MSAGTARISRPDRPDCPRLPRRMIFTTHDPIDDGCQLATGKDVLLRRPGDRLSGRTFRLERLVDATYSRGSVKSFACGDHVVCFRVSARSGSLPCPFEPAAAPDARIPANPQQLRAPLGRDRSDRHGARIHLRHQESRRRGTAADRAGGLGGRRRHPAVLHRRRRNGAQRDGRAAVGVSDLGRHRAVSVCADDDLRREQAGGRGGGHPQVARRRHLSAGHAVDRLAGRDDGRRADDAARSAHGRRADGHDDPDAGRGWGGVSA